MIICRQIAISSHHTTIIYVEIKTIFLSHDREEQRENMTAAGVVLLVEHNEWAGLHGLTRHLLLALGQSREDTRADRDQHLALAWRGADQLSQVIFQKVFCV